MARTFMKNKSSKIMNWKVSNKTTALSSLRTAQAGKSETRQNEETYYRIQKGFICQWTNTVIKVDVDFIDLNLLHKGSYWLFWT